MFWKQKIPILIPIILGIPAFITVYLLRLPSLGHLKLAEPECRLQKWRLPTNSTPTTQSVLIPRPVITCCFQDQSCLDTQLWGDSQTPGDKTALIQSIDRSLTYLNTPRAETAYKNYPISGITLTRTIKSLQRFRQLVQISRSPQELNSHITQEFQLYQSIGSDRNGSVLFTAYYEPVYQASRTPSPAYKYPIYRRPPDLEKWPRPHPTRIELEGADGLQASRSQLRGLEIFWFRDRMEPILIQIQGSAKLQLTDGGETHVGYAGNTRHNYQSIGRALADDGVIPIEEVTMPAILEHFRRKPQDLNVYIPRDPSFVFFQENPGIPATGSIGVQLTADRSIATDKSLMPPGGLALIRGYIPVITPEGKLQSQVISRFVLDQDTGGAIKTAGRVDYFVGTGKVAGDRAGITKGRGQLFYLFLK